ncbi:hypothetical protein [Streptomyces sp. NPDC059080]|uniref:hypothetical protein n=1 Tax=Streptomyces sp. NPDC059080 TaxID=3346718 RepID=UPI0036D11444
MSVVPIRHRRIVVTRHEYALPLPAPIHAVRELLDAAGAALADGRQPVEATVRELGGELVVSFETEQESGAGVTPTPLRKVGFA